MSCGSVSKKAWIPAYAGMTKNKHASQTSMRCPKFVAILICGVAILCTNASAFAKTINVEEGLRVERLRQASDIKGLEQLVQESTDTQAVQYAKWNLKLLDARSGHDKQAIEALLAPFQKQLAVWEQRHPYSLLMQSLMAEVQFYDLWATELQDPSMAIRFGMPNHKIVDLIYTPSINIAAGIHSARVFHLNQYPTGTQQAIEQRAGFLEALACHIQAIVINKKSSEHEHANGLRTQALNALIPFDNTSNDPWQLAESAAWLKVEIQLAQGKLDQIVEPKTATTIPAQLARAMLHAARRQVTEAYAQLLKDASTPDWQSTSMQLLLADTICRIGLGSGQYNLAMSHYVTLLKRNDPVIEQAIRDRLTQYDWLEDKPKALAMDVQTLEALFSNLLKPVRKGQQLDTDLRERFGNITHAIWSQNRPKHPSDDAWLKSDIRSMWYSLAYPQGRNMEMYRHDVFNQLVSVLKVTKADDALIYESLIPAMRIAQMIHKKDQAEWVKCLAPYQDLSRLLFGRFNTTQLADDCRLFDVVAARLPAKEYNLALQRLSDLPASHEQYWLSLRYQLGIYRQLINHPDWPDARLVSVISPIRDQAVSHLGQAYHNQLDIIEQVALESSGMLWQLAVKQNQWQSAAAQLQWIETNTSIKATDRQTWLCRGLISLQRAGQWERAGKLAAQLLEQFGKPVFGVVMQVLSAMDEQCDIQRHAQMRDPKFNLDTDQLDALTTFSKATVRWARVNIADEHQVLLAKIIWAKCLCDARQMRDAVMLLSPLVEQFESEPALWLTLAECHYQLKIPDGYQQAAKLYHQLISRSLPDAQGKFPPRYWHAWTRYLQVCDLTNQHTDVILSRIASLKAEDSTLGGEPYQSLLNALASKYTVTPHQVK